MVNNKIKVLIIDDNPDNILSLKAVIQTMLPETIIATALNGKTGIVLAKENDPDIILLDIVMPIMNGYQVCEIIKKDKDLMKIPVVFITALNANNEVRLKAIEVGAEGFLSKPIDELAMLTQIKSMAKIKKANTQQVLKRDELEKLVLVRTNKLNEELRQRIKAENLLKESEDKLRYNFDNSPIGISIVKMNGEIEVNNTLCKMLGYSKTKLEKVKWLDLTHSNDIETNQSIFNMVVNGKKDSMNYKKRLIKKDGSIVWADIHILLRKNSEGKPLYFITAIINITEQKKILEKLNQSEKRNREWLENSPVCTKILDQDFNLQYMSSTGVNGLGIKDITKYYNRPYPLDFFTESFSSVMRENLEHSKSTGNITTLEAPLYDLDQNEVWFHSTIVPIMDDVHELDYFIVVSLDVTQRKKAEYLMQKQKDNQRLLLEQLQTGILLISADKKILFANHFAAKTFNQTRNQMENMNVKDVPWSLISETEKIYL